MSKSFWETLDSLTPAFDHASEIASSQSFWDTMYLAQEFPEPYFVEADLIIPAPQADVVESNDPLAAKRAKYMHILRELGFDGGMK
ncbi:MAG: hypothetical protein LRY54_02115 [Alphaproteobacteria bacterium]|nr:hypothetical protein [Alphaproteobacteria bacterium]MCD8562859.1 hypothetical protein [Alphaproteobacteria bacterium]